jgi:hypothetical protein
MGSINSTSTGKRTDGSTNGIGTTLVMRDVLLYVSTQTLQKYVQFMAAVPGATTATDGLSFLYIRNYSSSIAAAAAAARNNSSSSSSSSNSMAVEASSVTLIAPEGARIRGVPLTVLQSAAASDRSGGSSSSNHNSAAQPSAAAATDPAGIVTATDSYVTGANHDTLLQLLQDLNSPQLPAQQPLLTVLTSNVTLSPVTCGSAWPVGGLAIRRPLLLVGSSMQHTSIDLGMQVRQIVLAGESADVTLYNVVLENLAYGDEGSSRSAEGSSIFMPSQLWAFHFKR